MTEQQEKPRGEVLLELVEQLLDINYKLFQVVDQRLTALEDECSKKEGD